MLEIKIFFVIEKVNMAHYSHTGKKAKKKGNWPSNQVIENEKMVIY